MRLWLRVCFQSLKTMLGLDVLLSQTSRIASENLQPAFNLVRSGKVPARVESPRCGTLTRKQMYACCNGCVVGKSFSYLAMPFPAELQTLSSQVYDIQTSTPLS
jgi:hypothetical protein